DSVPYEFMDANGNRYRVPATLHLAQLHVGGSPRARFVRGYGSGRSFVVQDGIREPSPLNLVGILHSDRDDYSAKALLDELESAAQSATQLVLVDYFGQDVQELPLLGVLPATVEPDGVDGSLLRVTLPLVPGRSSWTAPAEESSGYGPDPAPPPAAIEFIGYTLSSVSVNHRFPPVAVPDGAQENDCLVAV